MAYPDSKDTFRQVVDNVDDVLAQDHNNIANTVESLQDEVGYGKTDSNVNSVQHRLSNHTHNGTVGEGGEISLNDLADKSILNLDNFPSTLSGQSLKFLRCNQAETAIELYSLLIKHYIKGFNLKWASTTSLTIESGVIDVDSTLLSQNTNITSINPQTVGNYIETISTPPVSAFVYVYVYNNSGSVGYKLSTNAPNKSDSAGNTDGILRYYTPNGTTYYRCIGAIILDGSSLMYEFIQQGNYVEYTTFFNVSISTNQSANIPSVSRLGYFDLYCTTSGNGNIGIRPVGTSNYIYNYNYTDGGSGATVGGQNKLVICSTDANQKVDLVSTGTATATCKTVGYWMNIRD